MNEIPLKTFLHTYKESSSNDGRYCFVLGAGASRESGVMTGIEMAQIWSDELHARYSRKELHELMKKLSIKDIAVSSKNYFNIYNLRFFPDYQNGYSYIARSMESAEPSYGYYPLAMQLTKSNNNLVITTNFDTMVEDSLFIYTEKRPLVVGHELLAGYININTRRPVIAKIHRDLYFEPFNRLEELSELSEAWKKILKTVFQLYTPIMIGYAGGDNSLMDFLKDSSVELKGLYWCYYKNDKLPQEIIDLVLGKNGFLVPIDGFDSMMFSLSQMFSYDDPCERIIDSTKKRVAIFREKYTEFSNKAKSVINPGENELEVIDILNNENDKKIKLMLNRIDQDYNDKTAHMNLGYYYDLRKEYEKSIESYSNAIELQPDDESAYKKRGNAYYNIHDYERMLSDYNKAIDLIHDDAEAYNNRGIAYKYLEQYDKAMFDYNKAIDINPNFSDAYNNRGIIHYIREEFDKALTEYNKAIELKPDYAAAYNNRANVYGSLNEYKRAFSDYNKAIDLKPDYEEAYSNRGILYGQMGEYRKAISDYNNAINLKYENAKIYNNRGYSFYKIKNFKKALRDINYSIDLNPFDENAYDSRGCVYKDLKEYRKALSDFNRAIELNPNLVEAYRNRAEVYNVLGENEKAKEDIRKADLIVVENKKK